MIKSIRLLAFLGFVVASFLLIPMYPPENALASDGDDTADLEGRYDHKAELDQDFQLYWSVTGDEIIMAMRGRTEGWLSIGFEPGAIMKDADMIFGWVDPRGEVIVHDRYSTGETAPHPNDPELGGGDDITATGGYQIEGWTVVEFKRPLETGDEYDKDISLEGEMKVI